MQNHCFVGIKAIWDIAFMMLPHIHFHGLGVSVSELRSITNSKKFEDNIGEDSEIFLSIQTAASLGKQGNEHWRYRENSIEETSSSYKS